MKYILGFLGGFIGQLLASLFTQSTPIQWIVGGVVGLLAYSVVPFVRYTRFSPKQLLSFHGPDAPISRTQSQGELRSFLAQLHSGGLLLSFNPSPPQARVDSDKWAILSADERTTLAQVLRQAYSLQTGATDSVTIEDETSKSLLIYP